MIGLFLAFTEKVATRFDAERSSDVPRHSTTVRPDNWSVLGSREQVCVNEGRYYLHLNPYSRAFSKFSLLDRLRNTRYSCEHRFPEASEL
jgi:hypothetical protein